MDLDDAPISPTLPSSASPSPSPPPSPPVSVAPLAPVPYTTPPIQTLTLALPIQHPRPNSGSGGGGGREDCWSEGATSVLIDAWGERYLELSRGNLRQKHWQEVADAVTSRDSYTKAPKSDVQCKNRIDTLKKKYKVEKGKPASNWPFFSRLDLLLGPTHTANKAHLNPSPNSGTQLHSKLLGVPQFPQRQRTGHPGAAKRARSPPSVSSNEESSDGFPPEPAVVNGKKKRRNGDGEERKRMEGIRAVTHAIVKFGQVYERMETSRLQQEMEMEKHRIEFAKELELQRMQFFMKMQVELSQLEQPLGMRHGRSADAGTSNFNYLNDPSDSNSSD
ncbi:hypothetical protein LUZ63_001214 [Rhynchospora breviuscula]|uniref:Myb/SANT-like DNA-binding domain-containing protein n=1 Tax=Rhynchospora breviuscula TaxID=2022672 RepID=A0A9Q0CWZ7_9POAL|nr:hypothetical protein LUZ63_001214 [Rhynchospora breviuscula]